MINQKLLPMVTITAILLHLHITLELAKDLNSSTTNPCPLHLCAFEAFYFVSTTHECWVPWISKVQSLGWLPYNLQFQEPTTWSKYLPYTGVTLFSQTSFLE